MVDTEPSYAAIVQLLARALAVADALDDTHLAALIHDALYAASSRIDGEGDDR